MNMTCNTITEEPYFLTTKRDSPYSSNQEAPQTIISEHKSLHKRKTDLLSKPPHICFIIKSTSVLASIC